MNKTKMVIVLLLVVALAAAAPTVMAGFGGIFGTIPVGSFRVVAIEIGEPLELVDHAVQWIAPTQVYIGDNLATIEVRIKNPGETARAFLVGAWFDSPESQPSPWIRGQVTKQDEDEYALFMLGHPIAIEGGETLTLHISLWVDWNSPTRSIPNLTIEFWNATYGVG